MLLINWRSDYVISDVVYSARSSGDGTAWPVRAVRTART